MNDAPSQPLIPLPASGTRAQRKAFEQIQLVFEVVIELASDVGIDFRDWPVQRLDHRSDAFALRNVACSHAVGLGNAHSNQLSTPGDQSRHAASGTHYQDRSVDYEALSLARNAPRWIKMLRKHGFMSESAAA